MTPELNKFDDKSAGYNSDATNVVPFISNKVMPCPVPEKINPEATTSAGHSHLNDINALSAMELRKRYNGEASSHRNMLARQKANGAKVHTDFKDFTNFLKILGPKPTKKATLDRIDNSDPEYAPGKVRWADKKTQNSNKSDTIIIHDPQSKRTYTVSQLAKAHSVPTDTIRKRKSRGWTDAELIKGEKEKPAFSPTRAKHQVAFPKGLYTIEQLTLLHRSEGQLKHCAEFAFYRNAHDQQAHRSKTGEEYFPATFDEMLAILPEAFSERDREKFEKRFARDLWPIIKPHIIYSKLSSAQQQLVMKIDPEYVAQKMAASESEL